MRVVVSLSLLVVASGAFLHKARKAAAPINSTVAKVEEPAHSVLAVRVSHSSGQPAPTSIHQHAAAAQASAEEAAQHLEQAKAAYAKTKANVQEIVKTGKKIEDTAGDIKTLYTPDGAEQPESPPTPAPAAKAEPEPASQEQSDVESEFEKAFREQQAQSHRNSIQEIVINIIIAIVYYVLIVSKYPPHTALPSEGHPNFESARQFQSEVAGSQCGVVEKTFGGVSMPNILFALCCGYQRNAHTLYSSIGFNYWAGFFITMFCPCCTMWYQQTSTRVNEAIGGTKRSCLHGFLCAWCCMCCLVATDAESLDIAAGKETYCCGVRDRK
jgi:hypothetical protein